MDKTSLVMREFEKITKEKIFSIRPLDDDHPNHFLVNYSILIRATDPRYCELLFHRRQGEYYFYQQAVNKRISLPSPGILFYIPRGHLKAEAYLDGTLCPAKVSKEEASQVIDALAALHNHRLEGQEFDPFEHFFHYKKLTKNTLPTSFEDELIRRMKVLRDSSPLVASHNDIKRRHIIFRDQKAYLLDMSNAGENSPIFDLASFFLDVDLSPDIIRACLERYQKTTNGRTYLYQDVFDAMSFLCAYDYYHYSALAQGANRPFFEIEAKKRKAKVLQLFEETLA
ncbi:MAG: phosphotransferase [Bacilli bacterium]|nr:phosphotransferase [Bacilli bacterium]